MSSSHAKGLWSGILTKRIALLGLIGLGSLIPASAQTTVFNCSSFAAAGACSTSKAGYPGNFVVRNGGDLSGSVIDFVPANSGHNGYGLTYYEQVNVQSFVTTFTFIPNGQNISFVVQNTNNTPGYDGIIFSSGAGCEAGFYQAFGTGTVPSPNNLFALELDSDSWLTEASAAFTYSSVQIYQSNQSPCLPNDNGPAYVPISKISTFPVALDSPANAQYTTTGDVYSATVSYDGSTLSLSLYDVTAGGSCPGSNCFTQSWRGVNIPSIVAGTTAYVGFTAGANIPNLPALWFDSWSYTSGTSAQAAIPVISPAAGNYASTQSVTLLSASPGAIICYNTTGAPATNGATGCTNGTLYTAAIPVLSSQTLFAIAGGTGYGDSAIASAAYTINLARPSVATPTFSLPAGSYTSTQSVTISDATSGATIYYTTNGSVPTTASTVYAGAIPVASTETVEAIAAATGDSNSAVASAAYTISVPPLAIAAPTFSPAAGTYNSAQSVTLSDATSGATIYYTTDGTTPTTSSTAYIGAIAVNSTETLQAIAVASNDSAVASAVYTITAKPNFTLATSVNSLTINSGNQGAVMVTVTPANGFNSPVVLACAGLPTWATCSFSESTVTPSGGPATTQLIISTSSQSAGSRFGFPLTALAMTVGLFGWRRRRGWVHGLFVLIAYGALGLLFGCSGASGSGGPSSASPMTATVTLTAVSGTLQGSAAVAITLN